MGKIRSLWHYDEGSDAAIGTTITHGRCRAYANSEVELMNRIMAYYAIIRFRFRMTQGGANAYQKRRADGASRRTP